VAIRQEQTQLTARDGASFPVTLHWDDAVPQKTAFLIMHPTGDWQNHFILPHLVARGFAALGCTNRHSGHEAELLLENTLVDWGACVDHLRAKGYSKVIGIGNSGGGEIVSGYQAQAIHPTLTGTPTGDPPDFTKLKLAALDGIVFLNSHMGRPQSMTQSLDPSVGGESGNDPLEYDASLDMYKPENGPPYAPEFVQRYRTAQVERNHKITRWCREAITKVRAAGNPLMQDITFIVHRTDASLLLLDKSLDPSDRSGLTIWDEDPRVANYTPGPQRGPRVRLRVITAKGWLSQRSLEASQFDVPRFLADCTVPTVVIIGTADAIGTEHSRQIFEASPDPGKTLVHIKDGTHFMRGQEDKQAEAADHIAAFAYARGLA
jgi:pimeloyl-ACP methyl ester carboxylesterase